MRIINNLNGTHREEILAFMKDADEFILVSPFLMESFDTFFNEVKSHSLQKLKLITTIKDISLSYLKKLSH